MDVSRADEIEMRLDVGTITPMFKTKIFYLRIRKSLFFSNTEMLERLGCRGKVCRIHSDNATLKYASRELKGGLIKVVSGI